MTKFVRVITLFCLSATLFNQSTYAASPECEKAIHELALFAHDVNTSCSKLAGAMYKVNGILLDGKGTSDPRYYLADSEVQSLEQDGLYNSPKIQKLEKAVLEKCQ